MLRLQEGFARVDEDSAGGRQEPINGRYEAQCATTALGREPPVVHESQLCAVEVVAVGQMAHV